MVSAQVRHYVQGFDDLIREGDSDYSGTGLKVESVVRLGRLAVVQGELLLGAIGQIAPERLQRIKGRLAEWLSGS
jgi:mRNA interferase MazF